MYPKSHDGLAALIFGATIDINGADVDLFQLSESFHRVNAVAAETFFHVETAEISVAQYNSLIEFMNSAQGATAGLNALYSAFESTGLNCAGFVKRALTYADIPYEVAPPTNSLTQDLNYWAPASLSTLFQWGSTAAPKFLSGTAGTDLVVSGSEGERLDGGEGADAMLGGAGDDVYIVDNLGDRVVENPGSGTDTVITKVNYTLASNLENGVQDETAWNGSLTGNELDNILQGNSHSNHLFGMGGADKLYGGSGEDVLEGGAGSDALVGGLDHDVLMGGTGNDTYYWSVGDGFDEINETSGDDTLAINATAGSVDRLYRDQDDNLVLRFKSQQTVTVKDYFGAADHAIERIEFNGTTWDKEVLDAAKLYLEGTNAVETLEFAALGRVADFGEIWGRGSGDTLLSTNLQTALLRGGLSSDKIYLKDETTSADIRMAVNEGNDQLYLSSVASNQAHLFIDGVADPVADFSFERLGTQTNTVGVKFVYNGAAYAGQSIITVNNLNFADGTSFDVTFNRPGDAPVTWDKNTLLQHIRPNGTSGTDYLRPTSVYKEVNGLGGDDFLYGDGTDGVVLNGGDDADALYGQNAAETLNGGSGDDFLRGLGGTDTLTGGEGTDTYEFSRGGGHDTIYTKDATAGDDIIRLTASFAGVAIDASREADSLILQAATGERLTIADWFLGGRASIELQGGGTFSYEAVNARLGAQFGYQYSQTFDAEDFSAVVSALDPAFANAASYYGSALGSTDYLQHVFDANAGYAIDTGRMQGNAHIYRGGWRAGTFNESAGVTEVVGYFELYEDQRVRSATQAYVTNPFAMDAVERADLWFDYWQDGTGHWDFAITDAFTANGGNTVTNADGSTSIVPLNNVHQLRTDHGTYGVIGQQNQFQLFGPGAQPA